MQTAIYTNLQYVCPYKQLLGGIFLCVVHAPNKNEIIDLIPTGSTFCDVHAFFFFWTDFLNTFSGVSVSLFIHLCSLAT